MTRFAYLITVAVSGPSGDRGDHRVRTFHGDVEVEAESDPTAFGTAAIEAALAEALEKAQQAIVENAKAGT